MHSLLRGIRTTIGAIEAAEAEAATVQQPAGGGTAIKASRPAKATKAEVEKEFAAQLLNPEQRDRLAAMSDRQLADHFHTHPKTVRRTEAFSVLQKYRGPAHDGRTIRDPGAEYITSSEAPVSARRGYQRKREIR